MKFIGILVTLAVLAGCDTAPDPDECVAGSIASCTCAVNGVQKAGVVECTPERTWGPCFCNDLPNLAPPPSDAGPHFSLPDLGASDAGVAVDAQRGDAAPADGDTTDTGTVADAGLPADAA